MTNELLKPEADDCPQGAAEELAQERGEEAEAATETANRGRAC
jgi:hypothetical protein